MFSTAPILWLQSWSSPALTAAMNVVSLFGYFPSSVAVAVVYAFGWRLRTGTALILCVALAAVLTDAAKSTFHTERPHRVDNRVEEKSAFLSPDGAVKFGFLTRSSAVGQNSGALDYGFPSGHVAATTALTACAWWIGRRRWIVGMTALWLPMMALSRLYLGRHFLGDVIGGIIVGLISVVAGFGVLGLGGILQRRRIARTVSTLLIAAVGITTAMVVTATPRPMDAGRFVGFVVAVGLLLRLGLLEDVPETVANRVGRLILAVLGVGLTVLWAPLGSDVDLSVRSAHFALAVGLNAAILIVPAAIVRKRRGSVSPVRP